MSGAAPDPLDRIVQSISPGRGDDGMVTIDRAVVYRLVEIARAARDVRDGVVPPGGDDPYDRLVAALARLDKESHA